MGEKRGGGLFPRSATLLTTPREGTTISVSGLDPRDRSDAASNAAPSASLSASASASDSKTGASVSGVNVVVEGPGPAGDIKFEPHLPPRRAVIPFSLSETENESAEHKEMSERHYLFWVSGLFYGYMGGAVEAAVDDKEDGESEVGKQYQLKLKTVANKIFNECRLEV